MCEGDYGGYGDYEESARWAVAEIADYGSCGDGRESARRTAEICAPSAHPPAAPQRPEDSDWGQQLDAAYANLRLQLRAADAEQREFRGPCRRCAHAAFYEGRVSRCQHPLVVTVTFDRERGRKKLEGQPVYSCGDGVPPLCGPSRRLWEPRPGWLARLGAWAAGRYTTWAGSRPDWPEFVPGRPRP